jgi:hypothetical protein
LFVSYSLSPSNYGKSAQLSAMRSMAFPPYRDGPAFIPMRINRNQRTCRGWPYTTSPSPRPAAAATAKASDYSLTRWEALTRYLDDGTLPPDNNHVENQIRPVAVGRSNWLFAGSLRAGQRAAAVMSLIQSAKLNGHDPYAYLTDVFTRLPSQPASRIGELLPHNWQSS